MKNAPVRSSIRSPAKISSSLLKDVRGLIESARGQIASAVNVGLVMLNWHVGQRIRRDVLGHERAEYGKKIVATLSQQLMAEYGRGYTVGALSRMMSFAEMYPDRQIVATLSQQLGWSHFVELISFDDSLKRDFYSEMCRIEKWNVRTLRSKINGMLFERAGLSKKPKEVARMELAKLRKKISCRRILSSAIHTFSTSLASKALTVNVTLSPPSSINWNDF